jgi:hypothetical protein
MGLIGQRNILIVQDKGRGLYCGIKVVVADNIQTFKKIREGKAKQQVNLLSDIKAQQYVKPEPAFS